MDTNKNLDTTFYKYLNKYNELIKKYQLNPEQNTEQSHEQNTEQSHEQNTEQSHEQNTEQDPVLSWPMQVRTESGSRPEQSRDQNDSYHDTIFRYTINHVLFRSDVSEDSMSLPEQTRSFPQHRRGSLPEQNRNSIILSIPNNSLVQDIEGYKTRIYNVIVFLKKYPNVLNILPDENMTSRRIKFFLMSSYNELFFDKDVFLNVWMDFFKWKLTYSDLNDPPCR
jgi:superfamily II RNA helicase